MASKLKPVLVDGYVDCPVLIAHHSEGFTVCRERDRPTVCKVPSGDLGRYFPSGKLTVEKRSGPRVKDRVSWKHGKGRRSGRVYDFYNGEALIRFPSGAKCGIALDRLTIEEG